jgi:TrpR-related protein YerC/YecD
MLVAMFERIKTVNTTKKNTNSQALDDLINAILHLKDADMALRFLKDLTTPQELHALAERWRVCQLLADGNLSYRDIHSLTGASLATIVRVARFLKDEPFHGYQAVLENLKKQP